MHRRHRPRRRHIVGVPRGILFYIVLSAMNYRPMSGTELMETIEEVTGWRPSPGSIYPLLARLRRGDLIEPSESEEPGLKCFTLTEKGREEVEKNKKRRDLFRDRYHTVRRIYLKLIKEMDEELFIASVRIADIIEEMDITLKEKGEDSERVKCILKKAAEKIEEIKRELQDV